MKFVSEKHNKNFDPGKPPECSECGEESAKLIKFEDSSSGGYDEILLCNSCLNDALKLINDYTD